MSTTTTPNDMITRPENLTSWAEELGRIAGENAARHDDDGSWIDDSFEALRARGYLALAVPAELGGMGATIAEIAGVQRVIGRHCGSTALAMSMHQHVTAFTAWR